MNIDMQLPWPPSVNHYWERTRSGGMRVGDSGLSYRGAVARAVAREMIPLFTGRLGVTVVARPPDRRRRDLDNICKALLDALAHAGVYKDDSQIDDLRVIRDLPSKGGSVDVEIRTLGADS